MPAFERLRSLAVNEASGEFIAATTDVEVHVYLQRGRVAWGTSSTSRQTFRDHLHRQCGLKPEVFKRLLESCRRERRPVGEALVKDGLASSDQVRMALRHQVATALAALRHARSPHTLFLPRESTFSEYDAALTFTLESLLAEESTPTHAGPDAASHEAAPEEPHETPQQLVRRVADVLPMLQWMEFTDETGVVARHPQGPASDSPQVHRVTTLLGAHRVILRRSSETLLGVAVRNLGGSLWGSLSTPGQLTGALHAFSRFGTAVAGFPAPAFVGSDVAMVGKPPVDLESARVLLEQDPETCAVAVVGPQLQDSVIVGRKSLPLAALMKLALSRGALLPHGVRSSSNAGAVAAIADAPGWWFGAPLASHQGTTAWVLTRESMAPGLGWAVVRSLTRRFEGQAARADGE